MDDILDGLAAYRDASENDGDPAAAKLIDRAIVEIEELRAVVNSLQTNIAHLLKQIGEPALCSGCGASIWFVRHLNGKRTPYTAAGLNHFADCPAAKQFRRK